MMTYASKRATQFLADMQTTVTAITFVCLALTLTGIFYIELNIMVIASAITAASSIALQVLANLPLRHTMWARYAALAIIIIDVISTMSLLNYHVTLVMFFPVVSGMLYPDRKMLRLGMLGTMIAPCIAIPIARAVSWQPTYFTFLVKLTDPLYLPEQYYWLQWTTEKEAVMYMIICVILPHITCVLGYMPFFYYLHSQEQEYKNSTISISAEDIEEKYGLSSKEESTPEQSEYKNRYGYEKPEKFIIRLARKLRRE